MIYDGIPIDGDFFESFGNEKDIVYRKTELYEDALNLEGHHKILITHNSDKNITKDMLQKFLDSGKYDLWFAQNVDIKHERLIPIPIGLERKRWCKFSKFGVIKRCRDQFNGIVQDKLYANFSIGTQLSKRAECIQSFLGKDYLTNKVAQMTPMVQSLQESQYEQYCNDILSHKYVLCPEGNGIDTHRMWEVLYLGRIPVVLHNPTNDAFSDMPVLILDRWEDFECKDKSIGTNTEKLDVNYWIKLMNH